MRPVFLRSGFVASCLMIGLLTACGDKPTPTQPTTPPPASSAAPPATAGPNPQLTTFFLTGEASVPPGTTARYTATARWSDGSSRDVTAEAVWSTTDGSVLSVTAPGTVVGQATGEARVEAAFLDRTDGRLVYVLPEGRFVVFVHVSDGEIEVAPIFDARVEVPGTGISATTDWYGTAKLFGVPADLEIRVTKDGFQSLVRPARISRHTAINVQLFRPVPGPS